MGTSAAIYCRISNDKEGLAYGVERQEQDCRALAQRLGVAIVSDGVFVDNDLSASTRSRKKRPAFDEMMTRAENGDFGLILSYSNSRLTRRPMEFEKLITLAERRGTRIATVVSGQADLSTADGRAMGRTMAAWDAAEAERTAERVARAAKQRSERGEHHGGNRPFGYGVQVGTDDRTGKPVIDYNKLNRGEADELVKAYDQILQGVPLSAVARDMNARGVKTATGKAWEHTTLSRALRNPRNVGLAVLNGDLDNAHKAAWPAMVDREVWDSVKVILEDSSRRISTGNKASYLLSGLATCGKPGCGRVITSGGRKRSNTGTVGYRRVYVCRVGRCVTRRQDWVDEYVADKIIARLSREDAGLLLVDDTRPDIEAMRTEAAVLRTKLDELVIKNINDKITDRQLETATAAIRPRLDELEAAQAHVSRTPILAGLVGATNVRAAWEGFSLERQRAVVGGLVEVTLLPGAGTGKRTFNPDLVQVVFKD